MVLIRKLKYLIISLFMVILCLTDTLGQAIDIPNLDFKEKNFAVNQLSLLELKNEIQYKANSDGLNIQETVQLLSPTYNIPEAWSYEELAIFCKLEVKMEKALKFPIKVRLGEVNYAEMREGKPYTPQLSNY